jgi:hypothetical protein
MLGIRILSFTTKCRLRYRILMFVGHEHFVHSPEAAYEVTRSSPSCVSHGYKAKVRGLIVVTS